MPLNSQKEILLMQKDSGYLWHPNKWCFFGGKIEDNETSEEALFREIGEEIGGKKLLKNFSYFGEFPFYDTYFSNGSQKSRGGFLYAYSADFVGNVSDIRLNEGKGFTFLSRNELPK